MIVLGIAIAVADGLTRAPNPDLELSQLQPLKYEPYYAAFLLAGLTLPLMFAYAKKARMPLAEGLFLWFTFCTTAYMKDFSYLSWPGVPLFVTDAVLLFLLFCIYRSTRPVHDSVPLPVGILLFCFTGAGAFSAARGFLGHQDAVLVLRDSALVVYACFLLVGYHLFRSWLSIKRMAVWLLLGTVLSVLNGLSWFVVAPDQRRFIFPGIYVLVSLVCVLMMMASRLIRPQVGWIFAGFFSLGLLLANARSLFVSLAIVFLVLLVVPGLLRGKVRFVCLVGALAVAAVLACSFVLSFHRLQAARGFTARTADELASGVLHSGDDPYWQFRLAAWKEAWRRFAKYPPGGEGFGVPFIFEIWDNDARPHNTFLTALYKMGLIGFIPLFALLCYFFWSAFRALERHRRCRRTLLLQVGIISQIALCLYGMANFVLESPFLASLFWTTMGSSLRMIRMLDLEQLVRNCAGRFKSVRVVAESRPVGWNRDTEFVSSHES